MKSRLQSAGMGRSVRLGRVRARLKLLLCAETGGLRLDVPCPIRCDGLCIAGIGIRNDYSGGVFERVDEGFPSPESGSCGWPGAGHGGQGHLGRVRASCLSPSRRVLRRSAERALSSPPTKRKPRPAHAMHLAFSLGRGQSTPRYWVWRRVHIITAVC